MSSIADQELKDVRTLIREENCFLIPKQDGRSDIVYLFALEYISFELLIMRSALRKTNVNWNELTTEIKCFTLSPDLEELVQLISLHSWRIVNRISGELKTHLEFVFGKAEAEVAALLECFEPQTLRLLFGDSEPSKLQRRIVGLGLQRAKLFYGWFYRSAREIVFSVDGLVSHAEGAISARDFQEALAPDGVLLVNFILDPDLADLEREWANVDFFLSLQSQQILLGLFPNSELQNIKRGYRLVEPKETLDDVELEPDAKRRLRALVEMHIRNNFSTRLTLLLKGPPGTGKSLISRAVARELGHKCLVVQHAPTARSSGTFVSMFLARARKHKALIVFEECEDLFGRNLFTGKSDAWAKVLFENYEGAAVFTTNYNLSYAMDRRMSMVIEVEPPSKDLRAKVIVREVEDVQRRFGLDTDFPQDLVTEFARAHAITGGYYRPILEMAAAQSTSGSLTQEGLTDAFAYAKDTLIGEATNEAYEPRISMKDVELSQEASQQIDHFISYDRETKRGSVSPLLPQGASAIFDGPPGSGKTIAAEAVANELGVHIRRISPSDLLSKYVGETEQLTKRLFKDATKNKYLLFIDEAEGLLASRENARASWERTQINEFLQQVEAFTGNLIIATNFKNILDPAFARRFLFQIHFAWPKEETRFRLWRKWQAELSLSDDLISRLSSEFEMSGGEIRNAAIRARVTRALTYLEISQLCSGIISSRTGEATKTISLR